MINKPSLLDTPNLINWKEFTPSDIPGSSVDDCYANDSTIRANYDGTDTSEWNTGKQIQETLPAAEWDAWMHDLNAYGWQITEIINSIYDELYSVINGQQAGMSHELLDAMGANAQTLTNKTISFYDNTMTGVVSVDTNQTLTNKTISFYDNTMTGVASVDTAQTLTNKTISFDDNTLQNVASLNTAQTLTNKTMDKASNTFTCSPTFGPDDSSSISVTKEMNLVLGAASTQAPYSIGNGPYAGFELRITVTDNANAPFEVNFYSGGATVTKYLSVGVHHMTWQDSSGWTFYEFSGEYTDNTTFTYLI